jgi:hypothetical protein
MQMRFPCKALIRFGVPNLPNSNSLDALMRLRAVIYYENRADGVLVVAQQPQSFNVKHDSSYLLGLDPETGNFVGS